MEASITGQERERDKVKFLRRGRTGASERGEEDRVRRTGQRAASAIPMEAFQRLGERRADNARD